MKRYHIITMGLLCLVAIAPHVLEAQQSRINHPEIGLLITAQVHNSIHVAIDVYNQPLASLGRLESLPGYQLYYASSQQMIHINPTHWIEMPCVQAFHLIGNFEINRPQSSSISTCGVIRSNPKISRFTIISMSI